MSLTVNRCLQCSKEFTATHGNREYCPDSDCQKAKKAATQKKYYEVYKDMLSGYIGNYRLFEEKLGKTASKTVELQDFQIEGFDQNGYYGSVRDGKQKDWHLVKHFAFHIFHEANENKTYLTIKKITQ